MKLATSASLLLTMTLAAAELPLDTPIQIRLQTKVGSSQSKSGDVVKAVVTAPVYAGGQAVVPQGSTITGTVKLAQPPKDATDRARLALEFGELSGVGDKPVRLAAQVTEVDNARETVDENGVILGILGSETLSSQMDKALERLGQRASGLAGILQAAKGAILKPADVGITYETGVEMTLKLTRNAPVGGRPDVPPIPGADELAALVNRQPFRTMAEKPSQPSDLTNLMFIGPREWLEAAFTAGGWVTAEKLNSKTGLETFRAIAEDRGYRQAPVSTLLLDGNKPDLVFQKQNNTFAKRHHLRIWKRPERFQGQDVWVSAATHDIGIEFSPQNRTFIHKIDSHIDQERAKVVNDLLLTGQVKGLALVERPAVPAESQNATGDQLFTDRSMAVLVLGGR